MSHLAFRMLGFSAVALIWMQSCASDGNEPEPVEEPGVIADTHTYIALRNDGQLFEIGGDSGEVSPSDKVPGVVFNTVFNTVTSSETATYFFEQTFEESQGVIFEKKRGENTSRRALLEFPEAEYGALAGLVSLDWSESRNELIGIVKDEITIEPGTFRLIGIDPDTFQITNYGILGALPGIRSTVLAGSNLYISALSNAYPSGYSLHVLNIENNGLNTLAFPNASYPPLQLSYIKGDAKLFGFIRQDNNNLIGAVRPVVYDADSESYVVLPLDENIALVNEFGKSYYDAQRNQHVALVATQGFFALLKYNPVTQQTTLKPLRVYGELSSLIGIIDVR